MMRKTLLDPNYQQTKGHEREKVGRNAPLMAQPGLHLLSQRLVDISVYGVLMLRFGQTCQLRRCNRERARRPCRSIGDSPQHCIGAPVQRVDHYYVTAGRL